MRNDAGPLPLRDVQDGPVLRPHAVRWRGRRSSVLRFECCWRYLGMVMFLMVVLARATVLAVQVLVPRPVLHVLIVISGAHIDTSIRFQMTFLPAIRRPIMATVVVVVSVNACVRQQ